MPSSRSGFCWLVVLSLISSTVGARWLLADEANDLAAAGSRITQDLTYLASDELAGRGVGTEGIQQAGEFIAARFRELGLKTDAFDGQPFQNFGIPGPKGLGPAAQNVLKLKVKGEPPTDAKLAELKLSVDYTPLTLGSNGQFSGQVAFAGYGISAPELNYDDFAGWDPTGKVIIVLRKEPQQNDPNSVFDGTQNSNYAFFTAKEITAASKKAAAMIVINDAQTVQKELAKIEEDLAQAERSLADIQSQPMPEEAQQRDALQSRLKIAAQVVEALKEKKAQNQGDAVMKPEAAGTPANDQAIPTFYCTRAVVDRLLQAGGARPLAELEAAIDRDGKPHSIVLDGVEASGETLLQATETPVRNVIAVLPGAGELADEYVVVGAHYDHVGMGGMGSLAPGTIAVHNGADDNGSGTVCMLEVARQLSTIQTPNRRSVIFMAFSAEESGLLGSVHYVRNPRWPLEKTVAMVNMDMVGRLANNELTVYGTGTAIEFAPLIDRLNEIYKFNVVKVPQGRGASDHQSFYDVRVPVFHFFTGLHNEYHRPSDDVNLINVSGIARISRMVADVTKEIIESPTRPQYVEVRGSAAPRSQSGAGRAMLGVRLERSMESAPTLVAVNDGGPAAKAGLQAGDTITAIDGAQVKSVGEFREAMSKLKNGQTVSLEFKREAETKTVEVKLGE